MCQAAVPHFNSKFLVFTMNYVTLFFSKKVI